MFITVLIGEEIKTNVKSFLLAPSGVVINKGDCVKAGSVTFKVNFVEFYHDREDFICIALTEALGNPMPITSVIREEAVKWE